MKRKQIITFVVNDIKFFLSHRGNLITLCQKMNFEINIICPSYQEDIGILDKVNIINYHLIPRSKNLFLEIYSFISLMCKVYLIKTDIFHVISLKPILYAGLSILVLKKSKCIFSFSGLGFFKNINKKKIISKIVIKLLILILNSKCQKKLIFQNTRDLKVIKSLIKKLNENDFKVINGSGVDLIRYLNIYEKKKDTKIFRFTFASRLLREKGIETFLNAIEYFLNNNNYNNIEFYICGEFIENEIVFSKKIDFISHINRFKNKVKYFGKLDNLDDIFRLSNVIVLPTYYGEGVPKILCESLACGIPIITSYQRGCIELINNQKNGFACNSKNHQDLTLQFIKMIKLSKNEYYKMSQNCIKYANKNLSLEKITETHKTIYETI